MEEAVAGAHGAGGGWIAKSAKRQAVIPGRYEASNPESRDSPMRNCPSEVWCLTHHPGLTLAYRTTPEIKPALRRGGLISFFKKQCASRPT
jgi:hypothetical protein